MAARLANGPRELDVLGWMGRTALELIGQGGLGYSFDPLVEDASESTGDAIKTLLYVPFYHSTIAALITAYARQTDYGEAPHPQAFPPVPLRLRHTCVPSYGYRTFS